MDAVSQHLATLLTEKFEVPAEHIDPQATLADLELDSLAVVELHLTLQEHWNVPLDENEADADQTVDGIARRITELLAAAATESERT
ncbi:hypothetical protein KCMC57_up55590 [Kitasatospora sp. CMC57]|uniref:Carrier domain-containing protein n=1 Tax=Kitasatospora sp. CMC57 TaxID=3231513 RepID=A0AB33K663_9ACTN